MHMRATKNLKEKLWEEVAKTHNSTGYFWNREEKVIYNRLANNVYKLTVFLPYDAKVCNIYYQSDPIHY